MIVLSETRVEEKIGRGLERSYREGLLGVGKRPREDTQKEGRGEKW